MNNCTSLEDVFGLGSGEKECSSELQGFSYGSLAAMAFLVLVVLLLVFALCCLALKLWRTKRKSKVAFFANSRENTFKDIESSIHDESSIKAEDKEEKEGKREEAVVQRKASPVLLLTEQDDCTAKKTSDKEAATTSSPGTGHSPDGQDEADDDEEYATVKEKGAIFRVSSVSSHEEGHHRKEGGSGGRDDRAGTGTTKEGGANAVVVTGKKTEREVSVSYDFIGEDSYLLSGMGCVKEEDDGSNKDGGYSQITSSIGVKILDDGDCGELRHFTVEPPAPPPSRSTGAVDIASLYSIVNKGKKDDGDETGSKPAQQQEGSKLASGEGTDQLSAKGTGYNAKDSGEGTAQPSTNKGTSDAKGSAAVGVVLPRTVEENLLDMETAMMDMCKAVVDVSSSIDSPPAPPTSTKQGEGKSENGVTAGGGGGGGGQGLERAALKDGLEKNNKEEVDDRFYINVDL